MMASTKELIKAAGGNIVVDLLLQNGKLINVFSGEIVKQDVAVHKGFVVGFGTGYKAKKKINLRGKYIAPGFIDGHVHIESSMVSISEFARAVVARGVTSVITDAHEIANVLGIDGIKYMLESSKNQPLNVFFMLPSCVPATNMETAGAHLSGFDLYPFLKEKWVLGLGEVMNFPGVINADEDMLDKMKIVNGKRIDGHSPGLKGVALSAYIASGITSDHESTTLYEAKEKLEKGMFIMVREGTSEKNLKDIIPLVNEKNYSRFFFVSDDRHAHDLVKEGSIDYIVRKSISLGLDPIIAIKMATVNTAEYFRLPRIGAVAPGYQADITVFSDLKNVKPCMVFRKGELVSVNGKFVGKKIKISGLVRGSINVRWLAHKDFNIPAQKKNINVIEVVPSQIITKKRVLPARIEKGFAVSDIKRDILKMVIVERHMSSGSIGKGFVKGFGLKKGAIASSVAHDAHNILCVGADDQSLFTACVEVVKMGGGLCVVDGEKVLGKLPLPIAGLMTDKPLEYVVKELEKLVTISKKLGCTLDDPFMTLSFLALPVIPELKLTDKGLVDVSKMKLVELFV
ncbi:MAG: Adenine deaminase [Elusimicrobia bacterium ADurb.Bin231]|nr:MAG: Adenine deaminase [Elusimicrobia bacterium ADurb.Bin231]